MQSKIRILIVEDEAAIRAGLEDVFVFHGYAVESAAEGPEGLDKALSGNFDLILLDLNLADASGLEAFRRVSALAPMTPVVVVVSMECEHMAQEAVRCGAQDYLVKEQVTPHFMAHTLRCAIESFAAKRALPYLSERDIDEIAKIDAEIDRAVAEHKREAQITLNHRFHTAIYSANPEQVTMPAIESLWLQLGPFMRVAAHHLTELYLVDRHAEAIAAMRARDAEALGRAIEADIREGVGQLDREVVDRIIGAQESRVA